jgi:hypothetical protein
MRLADMHTTWCTAVHAGPAYHPSERTQMRSELDVEIGAHGPGLTRQNQAIPRIFGLEDVARSHADLTLDTVVTHEPHWPCRHE